MPMGALVCNRRLRRSDWDHESVWLVGRVSPLRPVSALPTVGAHGVTRPTFRFMERPHDFDAMHWDHEPFRIPSTALRAPAAPLGEGWYQAYGSWNAIHYFSA